MPTTPLLRAIILGLILGAACPTIYATQQNDVPADQEHIENLKKQIKDHCVNSGWYNGVASVFYSTAILTLMVASSAKSKEENNNPGFLTFITTTLFALYNSHLASREKTEINNKEATLAELTRKCRSEKKQS